MSENIPELKEEQCNWISDTTWDYNCVGYVVGDYIWWHPEIAEDHYWPEGVSRTFEVTSYVSALETEGFKISNSGDYEAGIDTIVLYGINGMFKHVSLVREDNRHGAKLGEYEDLVHKAIDTAGGYGAACEFMKREPSRRSPLPNQYLLQ